MFDWTQNESSLEMARWQAGPPRPLAGLRRVARGGGGMAPDVDPPRCGTIPSKTNGRPVNSVRVTEHVRQSRLSGV